MCLTTPLTPPLTPPPSRDLYAPPDEVAQDVLEFSSQVQLDSGARVRVKISPRKDTPDREIDGILAYACIMYRLLYMYR